MTFRQTSLISNLCRSVPVTDALSEFSVRRSSDNLHLATLVAWDEISVDKVIGPKIPYSEVLSAIVTANTLRIDGAVINECLSLFENGKENDQSDRITDVIDVTGIDSRSLCWRPVPILEQAISSAKRQMAKALYQCPRYRGLRIDEFRVLLSPLVERLINPEQSCVTSLDLRIRNKIFVFPIISDTGPRFNDDNVSFKPFEFIYLDNKINGYSFKPYWSVVPTFQVATMINLPDLNDHI